MNLKTFNTTNVQSFKDGLQKPMIHVSSKTGLFYINQKAFELIGLKAGDMVQFHQDEDELTDWFIEKVKKDGFAIRCQPPKGNFFSSTKIARMIFDSVSFQGKGGRIYIGEAVKHEKSTLFTLITASLVNA